MSVCAEPASSSHQVVEGEHQRLDALGALAVALFERGNEAGFGLAVEVVEDFRHHLVGVAAAGLREVRHEFGAQRLLDALQNVLLHRFHLQHAVDHVEREVLGQNRKHARGVLGPELRKHDGDGLSRVAGIGAQIAVAQVMGRKQRRAAGEIDDEIAVRSRAVLRGSPSQFAARRGSGAA